MVPDRAAAAALFLTLSPSASLRRHAAAVADIGSFLARAAARAGRPVDRRLVESTALLHDLDKALPKDHPLRLLGHGHAGAQWLRDHGLAELAPAVDTHPVDRLAAQPWDAWVAATTIEQRFVAYSDKRAEQTIVSLDRRFRRWERRHPDMAEQLAAARTAAALLEQEVCERAGVSPTSVQRLRWATRALQEAAAS